jgi:hypothetical protein
MAAFTRLEIWDGPSCHSGTRVAVFEAGDLASATLRESLTGAEGLSFAISRTHASAAEIVHGRIARVCWSDTSLDTEWRIADDQTQSGTGDRGQLAVECQALALDLAAAPYVEWSSLGEPSCTISGLQLTAAEWLTAYVLPACNEAGLFPITVGTINFTNLFDLDGEFQTALQINRAITEPGRAPGEFVLRRNGSTDYQMDILTARGASATAVRVQTAHNLLEHTRKRSLGLMATKIVPRGNPSGIVRTMAHASWIATVVDGTHADLSDPAGGAGPIAFDDELNGLYVARQASTFSSQAVSDSAASNQRITVASTAGWTTGDRVQFRRTSGSGGERLASLQHPTAALATTAGGYGRITRFLDVPSQLGENNLVPNPRNTTWSNHANPPDGWGFGGDYGSYDTGVLKFGDATYAVVAAVVTPPLFIPQPRASVNTGICYPFTTANVLHAAHVWVRMSNVYDGIHAGARGTHRVVFEYYDVTTATLIPLITTDIPRDSLDWYLFSAPAIDFSAAATGIRLYATVYALSADDLSWVPQINIGGWSLNEGADDIADVEYPGGNVLWQRANVALAAVASPVAGYTLRLADLARLDGSPWADEPLVLGGTLDVTDSDLAITTSQRVVELGRALLNPLDSTVQLSNPQLRASEALAG